MQNGIDETAIRQRVVKRIRQQMYFYIHLALGVPALLLASGTPGYDYGAKLVFFVWLFTFVGHVFKRFYDWQVERAVRREIDRELMIQGAAMKAKNDYAVPPRLRLAADGEIEEDDLTEESEEKVKRQRA